MKKTLVLLFAALLVVAFTVPASAFDSVFGGYNRVRYYIQQGFSGVTRQQPERQPVGHPYPPVLHRGLQRRL
jgi:hypothetical protein